VLRHDFVLKRHLGELREEGVFKMSLVLIPERCGTILEYENKSLSRGLRKVDSP